MAVEQNFVPAQNAQRAAQNAQISIAAQATALTFTHLKSIEANSQQHHPARLAPPFPVIAAKNQVRPVAPTILTKAVKHHRVQRLHRDVLLDVVGIERDIAKDRE
jgi:hypothetical protein